MPRPSFGQFLLRDLQGADGFVDFFALTFEMMNLRDDLLRLKRRFQIPDLVPARINDVVNFRKRETEPLTPEDQLEMLPVSFTIEARRTTAHRMQKTTVLIEAKRAKTDAEVPSHRSDGEQKFVRSRRSEFLYPPVKY